MGPTFATPIKPRTWIAAATKLRIARIQGAKDGVAAPTTESLLDYTRQRTYR